ncbi:MAG: RsiV family protein [Candidatus Omnitrophica bacterium]|nr:RsiV family protein [Candidatus Omnitrophota bacterium]
MKGYIESYVKLEEVKARDDHDFYMENDEFVVVFRKYEIACGAVGPVELRLPSSAIKEFLDPEGPLKNF